MNEQLLSRVECSALRGLAIIGIFLHNYCHWLNPIVKENEYTYTQHNVDWLTQVLMSPDGKLPAHLLSFFGHYGVPVFLFLSAFGLVMKYEKSSAGSYSQTSSVKEKLKGDMSFFVYHFLKLFKMMIVGFVAFIMIDSLTPGQHKYGVVDIISQMFLFNNVMPDPDNIIWPGPYWFFGLMFQFYIVYRLFIYRRHWSMVVGLTVVCWLMQMFCDPEGETLNRLRYNFMGGMLPFGAGVLYARYGKLLSYVNNIAMMILSAVVIFFFSYDFQAWLWVPLFICTFSVSFIKLLPSWLNSKLAWFGGISAALFVCHPVTRKILIHISREGDIYSGLILYVIASIAIAWLFKELLKHIPSPQLKA